MKVEIIHSTEENEIVAWHKAKGKIYRKKVRKMEPDIYRKELQKVRVIQTVIYPNDSSSFLSKQF